MAASAISEATIQLRIYHLRRLRTKLGRPVHMVAPAEMTEFFAAQAWKPNTKKSFRASLRRFDEWLAANGLPNSGASRSLLPVRVPRAVPHPCPDDANYQAINHPELRIRVAVRLAGQCGLRRAEVAKIHARDVIEDLVGSSLRVVGKGGHTRYVPLPHDLVDDLMLLADGGYVFKSPTGGHLTAQHLSKLVSRALPEGYSMHSLRHRTGTKAYQRTRDLRAVQELLGHARPETTAGYTFVESDFIRQAMEAAY